ncbi:MJ0042-type zinc finger domain-containing protein, partial [Acinetobacter baumannii]
MNEKQTRCPKCLTVYKVSLTQLTVAQGMVCCPKCNLNFNALTNLVGTVAKLAMRQPFVLFKGLTFQKLCL